MKKVDIVSWVLSIAINIAILFLLSYKSFINLDKPQEIKIGLVSLDSNAQTKFKAEQNRDAFKENLNAKSIEPKVEKKVEEVEQKTEKEVKEKTETTEVTKEVKKEEPKPKIDEKVIAKEDPNAKTVAETKTKEVAQKETKQDVKKDKPSLKDLKKSISESKPSSKNLVGNPDGGFSPTNGDFEYVDRTLTISGDSNGLVAGSINGTSTDGAAIIWANTNKNPSFPDTAKVQGKTGTMLIKVKVDQTGTVLSYNIEKGSGVPDIDIAVEKVIGSWNLKVKKNNKIVAGIFVLNYKFDFK
ncbi:MAG: TonB family protein [Fusobacteriaceae bacterium]|nr:TonB family protein [Fusobacteriaceae bacterium]